MRGARPLLELPARGERADPALGARGRARQRGRCSLLVDVAGRRSWWPGGRRRPELAFHRRRRGAQLGTRGDRRLARLPPGAIGGMMSSVALARTTTVDAL